MQHFTDRLITGCRPPGASLLNDDFTYVSSAWADDWLARGAELVEKYHPDIVYFDWWIGQASIRPNLAKFAAFYYNSSLTVTVTTSE
jgi:alpha-L-fucosidase